MDSLGNLIKRAIFKYASSDEDVLSYSRRSGCKLEHSSTPVGRKWELHGTVSDAAGMTYNQLGKSYHKDAEYDHLKPRTVSARTMATIVHFTSSTRMPKVSV